jgi:transposase
MSCFGVVYFDLIETSKQKVNSEIFQDFLRNLIQLTPENVIYYMDNCKIHHTLQVRGILDFHGIEYIYSSPYSPDYNPIELLFSFLKLRVKDYNHLCVPDAIRKALSLVTESMVRGWIKKSVSCWLSDDI